MEQADLVVLDEQLASEPLVRAREGSSSSDFLELRVPHHWRIRFVAMSNAVENIFYEAIALPQSERAAYVRAACGGDAGKVEEINRLLRSHDRQHEQGFVLNRSPLGIGPAEQGEEAEIAEAEGDLIGRYRLLERIGEGGMGVVYMAEQLEGVRRQVALKIIKLGMDTRQVIARFEVERQAMALFDHPNITRVFDAGATSTGRPYFVMELVRGTSITDYVKSKELSLAERLRLFVDICNAVHHAHQKGIIHRDLKPSNILVTHFDGVAVPKVIDFGIAKAVGQRLTDMTLFTRFAAMMGTPQYMSPEQAEMTGHDVDTRTDIYSLGVVLYELVTGSTPLAARELRQLNPIALYETLRNANIETPSLRASRMQATVCPDSSKQDVRTETPVSIPPERLKGDLDWIVMKALARDRNQRYDSAIDLGNDVGRFLAGDAVEAAPPSRLYALKAMARKYRTAAVSALLFTAVLVAATIACAVLAVSNYQSNQRLKDANQDLVATNKKLQASIARVQAAEEEIRQAAEDDTYTSAVSMANLKFDMEFQPELSEVARRLLKIEGTETLGFCCTYNTKGLFDLPRKELLVDSLQPVRRAIEEGEVLSANISLAGSEVFSASEGEGAVEHHSEYCELIRNEADALLKQRRHRFYRHLLAEYRKVFTDGRVAHALNLLAASLIDVGEFVEAEARLREAIALGDEETREVAKTLLKSALAGQAAQPAKRPREVAP